MMKLSKFLIVTVLTVLFSCERNNQFVLNENSIKDIYDEYSIRILADSNDHIVLFELIDTNSYFEDISVKELDYLGTIILNGCKLESINFENTSMLKYLDLSMNNLTEVPTFSNAELSYLNLSGNSLSDTLKLDDTLSVNVLDITFYANPLIYLN